METKSTKIEWNAGKNLIKSVEANSRKRSAPLQPVLDSFFSWFEGSSDMLSDEIGELIKDDIWNNPMQYYLSSEMDDEDEDGDIEDEEDEDEENIEQINIMK